MGLRYLDLDDTTRALMVEEIRKAKDDGTLYISPRLTDAGKTRWTEMLLEAASAGNDETLAASLKDSIVTLEARRKRDDFSQAIVAVPVTAADVLAEGEFNRYYIKAVCRKAIQLKGHVVVYRGKEVLNPNPESDEKVGTVLEPETLLDGKISSKPGSGLTVKLIA